MVKEISKVEPTLFPDTTPSASIASEKVPIFSTAPIKIHLSALSIFSYKWVPSPTSVPAQTASV